MSGLQVIILWLNITIPFVGYWLTYLLPFITLMVYITTQKRGFFIYSITSMLLVMLLIQPFIETTLFYFFPAWFLGIGYGVALKQKATLFSLLVMLSIIQFAILYLIQVISLQLFQLDLLVFVYSILNLDRNTLIVVLDPILIYTIGLLQVLIGLLLVFPLIERFHLPIKYQIRFSKLQVMVFTGLFIITFVSLFIFSPFAFFGIGPLVLFTIYSYVHLFMKPATYEVYLLLVGLVLYPFMNAILSSILEGPYRIFSVLFLSFFPLLISLYNSLTQKHKNALI